MITTDIESLIGVDEKHIADFRIQGQPLVCLVADFHGLGQIGPHLDVFKRNAFGGAGIVLEDQAVVPGAGEAVGHRVAGAGLEGEAVAVLPA